LRRWTNRRSQAITYGHDALHRRTSKSGTHTKTEAWAYPSDTVVVATSPLAVDTVLANRQGQLVRASTVMAGQNYVRRYTYTAAGALDSVIPSGGGMAFQARKYVWNLRRGTLTEVKLGASPAKTARAFNADGRLESVTFPGGDQVTRGYTSTHATASLTTTASYSATVNRASGLDAANRIQRHVVSPTAGHQFSYDGLGRLVADSSIWRETPCDPGPPFQENGDGCAWYPAWSVTWGTGFAYDSAGNRQDLGGTYALGNRITAFNGCSYVTDTLDGNVTSRTCGGQTVAFAWTAESRLASLTASGQTTTFDYNAAGRLIKKTTGGVARHFLWEGDNLLAELDGAGTGKIAEYSYYPGLDNPHALIVDTTKYFAHRDMLGNVIALTDSARVVQRWYEYDGWGILTGSSDYAGFVGKDRARFKGALWFGDGTDLYYMRNRWYEPRSGRFLSEDPVRLPGGMNQYTFAGNDPVNGRDPSGLLVGEGEQCVDWFWVWSRGGRVIRETYLFTTCDGGGDGSEGGPEAVCRLTTPAGSVTVGTSDAERINKFISLAVGYGATDLRANSVFRSSDKQASMWNTYNSEMALYGHSNTYQYGVAQPFSSCHELGACIDVNLGQLNTVQQLAVLRAASNAGLNQLLGDPIHFSVPGPEPNSQAWADALVAAQNDWVAHGSNSGSIPSCQGGQ